MTRTDLTLRQAWALMFAVAGLLVLLLAYTGVPGAVSLRGLATCLVLVAGGVVVWRAPVRSPVVRPVVSRGTWTSLQSVRTVLLGNAAKSRDRWAIVSIRHLDRIKPDILGGLVYSPDEHRVVMVWRGTTVMPIIPCLLSEFGLEAPRPFHLLRSEETARVRARLAVMKGGIG